MLYRDVGYRLYIPWQKEEVAKYYSVIKKLETVNMKDTSRIQLFLSWIVCLLGQFTLSNPFANHASWNMNNFLHRNDIPY